MSKRYILSIDEGTTSVRINVFDTQKNSLTSSTKENVANLFPFPGWVEQDAEEVWNKTESCLKSALSKINPAEIYGIGITNQRETVIAWDKRTGKPVCNAIVWQCRRTADYCNKHLVGNIAKTIYRKTGLVTDAYFSATKIMWLIQKEPKVRELLKSQNLCVGTMDSFLAYKLTQGQSFITDISNASRTMLCNINTGQWDNELLEFFKIPLEILPKIVDSDAFVGYYDYKGTNLPIRGMIGDQQSSLLGQLCINPGDLKNTYGTGSFMLMNTGEQPFFSQHKLLTTIAWSIKGKRTYAIEGSIFNCGSSIEWLKDIELIADASDCDSFATSVDSANGVRFVPAFTGLGSPYWDGNAKALMSGITRGATKAHIIRSVLESIPFSVKDIYDVIYEGTGISKGTIRVDGGVSKSDFTMQAQCNLLNKEIQCSKEKENTGLGAIFLCGLSLGIWEWADLPKLYKTSKIYHPQKKMYPKGQEDYNDWKKAVSKALTKEKGEGK